MRINHVFWGIKDGVVWCGWFSFQQISCRTIWRTWCEIIFLCSFDINKLHYVIGCFCKQLYLDYSEMTAIATTWADSRPESFIESMEFLIKFNSKLELLKLSTCRNSCIECSLLFVHRVLTAIRASSACCYSCIECSLHAIHASSAHSYSCIECSLLFMHQVVIGVMFLRFSIEWSSLLAKIIWACATLQLSGIVSSR